MCTNAFNLCMYVLSDECMDLFSMCTYCMMLTSIRTWWCMGGFTVCAHELWCLHLWESLVENNDWCSLFNSFQPYLEKPTLECCCSVPHPLHVDLPRLPSQSSGHLFIIWCIPLKGCIHISAWINLHIAKRCRIHSPFQRMMPEWHVSWHICAWLMCGWSRQELNLPHETPSLGMLRSQFHVVFWRFQLLFCMWERDCLQEMGIPSLNEHAGHGPGIQVYSRDSWSEMP